MTASTRAFALKSDPPEKHIKKGRFILHVNGLILPDKIPTLDEFIALSKELAIEERGLPFVIGDFVNAAEETFGEDEAAHAVDSEIWGYLGFETLRVYAWTSLNVKPANRFMDQGLAYSHHQCVAKLPPRQQRKWLKLAVNKGDPWTVSRLKAAMREGGDLPIADWLLLVKCGTEAKQAEIMALLEGKGLTCKQLVKRQRRKKDAEAA